MLFVRLCPKTALPRYELQPTNYKLRLSCMKQAVLLSVGLFVFIVAAIRPGNEPRKPETDAYRGWSEYLGGPDRSHYSSLTQINTGNVQKLGVAWTYAAPDSGQMQVNPIMVDGMLYGVTATVQAFALDAATGKEVWRFGDGLTAWHSTSRGVAYWSDGKADKRILYTIGPDLYALDALTGRKIMSFGDSGRVSLRTGLGKTAADKFVISNTPGTIVNDLIVMPLRVDEGAEAAPGYIQAFDVRTGKLAWTFHTIPQPGEFGYETWSPDNHKNTDVGGANCWAGMAVDRARNILYVPTGSAAFDFYGGNRKGQNLFANCLLALDARTGKRLWHYQYIHHDIWDRDMPAPPNLLTITRNGQKIDAVAQITKMGTVFVFDRVTGKPLFPIREVPVPTSTMPGEVTWPTQPMPIKPAPFVRQTMTEADINPNIANRDSIITVFRGMGKRPFEPFSKQPTLSLPGTDGGAEWGGAATDPQDGILYVNANEMAWTFQLIDTPKADALALLSPGERIYTVNCVGCHGPERKGNAKSGYPSLVNIGQRRDSAYINDIVAHGRGMMPGFTQLSGDEKKVLVAFLFGLEKAGSQIVASPGKTKSYVPYKVTGYNKFLDSKGNPVLKAPWGTLNAIDLNTGEYRWKQPLGQQPRRAILEPDGPQTGTENYGGPVVTAGGLLFIASTPDEKIRAFDKKTGTLLWSAKLPAAGFATPCTYEIGGKQFVVVACGGGKLGAKKGNQYVAFALP